jgi:putative ABC transport system substrate-binding protein
LPVLTADLVRRQMDMIVTISTPAAQAAKLAAGGLMSYEVNWLDLRRCAATYVDEILRGASPADLPVEDPVKFEMAKALGLEIGISLQLQDDEVIP